MTDGTEPLAPAKLLNSVEISERLRYELEQWFLLKKKHLQIVIGNQLGFISLQPFLFRTKAIAFHSAGLPSYLFHLPF